MKDSIKALYCKITAIVLAVIMVVLLISCFMPMVKVRTAELTVDPSFNTGRYTAGMTIPEAELGLGSLISFVGDFKMVNTVIKIQNNDRIIAQENEKLMELYAEQALSSSPDSYNSSIESCKKTINERQASTDEILANRTPEELEKLEKELLNDEDFLASIGLYYGFMAMFDDTQYTDYYPDYTDNAIHMIIFIFGIILFAFAAIALVIYLIVSAINVVIKTVYFAVRIKNADDKMLDRMFPKALAGFCGMIFICLFAVVVLNGNGLQLGSGVIVMLVCYVVANAIRGVSKILLADTVAWGNVVKFVISLIAVLLIFAAIVSFINVGIFGSVMDDAPAFMAKQYEVEYKKVYDAEMAKCPCASCTNSTDPDKLLHTVKDHANHISASTNTATSAAKKAANDGFKKNALIACAYDMVTMFVLAIGFISLVERLGAKTYKSKYSADVKSYGAMPAIGILLIICFLVPNFLFAAPDRDARIKAYEEGSIKIHFDDYKVADTEANVEYKALTETRKVALEAIDAMDKNAEGYANAKLHADRGVAFLDEAIDIAETSEKSSLVMGIVWSVLLTATSFAYIFAVKPLEAALARVFVKKSDGAETPAEEAPVDEAPAEETPADENTDAE